MAKGTYTYEYSDEHGDYTIRKYAGTNIAYKIYDTYDGEKDTPEKAMRRSIEERKAQGKDVSFLEKRLKDKPETKETKEKETSEKEDNGEPKLEYETGFHLEAPVNDFDAAQAYLSSDDMTQYIPEELQDVVKDVKWELDDEESGHISFKTTRELTAEESKKMSDWIDGQNSDGLGEGFEQQDFAISYYDPYSGDGPYTYDEYQREIENRFDNLDPNEYSDYLNDEAVEEGMKSYFEEMGKDYTEATDEEFEEARDAVLSNPEDYLDWQDIDTAKNDYMRDNEDLQEDHWYNMSSMKTNKGTRTENEFEVSELETTAPDGEYQKALDDLREYSGIAADQAKEANAPIEEIRDYTNQLKDRFEREQALDDYSKFKEQMRKAELQEGITGEYLENNKQWVENIGEEEFKYLTDEEKDEILKGNISVGEAYDLGWTRKHESEQGLHGPNSPEVKAANERIDKEFGTAEKNAMYEQDKELSKKINEPGFEDSLVERYRNDPEFREMMDTLTGGPQEGSRLAEVRKELEAQTSATSKTSDIAREFLNPDNEYTDAWLQQQAQENGIEIADLDREIGRQMREGGMSTKQRKSETANSADRAQRIIDDDEWYDVTVNKNAYGTKATLTDQRTGKTVELDPYDSDDVIKSKLNELRPGSTEAERYYSNIPEKEVQQDLEDRKWRLDNDRYPDELKESYQKFYDDGKEYYDRKYGKQAAKEDLDRTVDNFVKNNPRWEEGIYDETEAEEMFEKNGARTWDVVYDRQYEKAHNTKESIQDRYGLKDKRNEMTVYDYENGDIDEEELTDLLTRGNENKETIDRVINQNKKTTNETMNDKIREAATKKTRNKGIKTIAKEYYGEGWNKLSENQKQIWIERNESWLKSAVEDAKPKKERWKWSNANEEYYKTNEDGSETTISWKGGSYGETWTRVDTDANGKEISRKIYKTETGAKNQDPKDEVKKEAEHISSADRRAAYKKAFDRYLKKHEGSEMTYEQFKKDYKKKKGW